MNLKKYFYLTFALIFLYSCSIQKKRYSIGYSVQFNKNSTKKKVKRKKEKESSFKNYETHKNIESDANNLVLTNENTKEQSNFSSINNNSKEFVSVDIADEKTIETEDIIQLHGKKKISSLKEKVAVSNLSKRKQIRKIDRASKKINANSFNNKTKHKSSSDDTPVWVLYVLAWFIPFLAVGLVTNWETKPVVINILLTLLCGLPGIIHAMIVVSKNT